MTATDPACIVESTQDRARRLWDGDPASTGSLLLAELGLADLSDVLLPLVTDRIREQMRG